ncbi:MAG: hypothetical protein IPP88_16105 [Betaproteobacteria bacterium]|nr:hypothetical protein [Betaproteobacteria bacterium]
MGLFDTQLFFFQSHRDEQIVEARGQRVHQRLVYLAVHGDQQAREHDNRRANGGTGPVAKAKVHHAHG